MRAKLINEMKFERGGDVKTSLGIGKVREALDILESSFNNRIFNINIKDINNISVTYTERYKNMLEEYENDYEWILKYHPIDRFEIEDHRSEETYLGHVVKSNKWVIKRNDFWAGGDPNNLIVNKEYISSIEKDKKRSKEYAEVMVEALNDKFGKLWVFEVVEKNKIPR
jgi:hypothetical protein